MPWELLPVDNEQWYHMLKQVPTRRNKISKKEVKKLSAKASSEAPFGMYYKNALFESFQLTSDKSSWLRDELLLLMG